MLTLLHIENIAVISEAEIAFAPGFNVLTGETGAGKSIVVDAMGAVVGERTSRDLIRTGARRALVSAQFDALPDLPWFAENGVAPEDGSLLLTREIFPDGRNVCRAGGRLVTVGQLRALGSRLLNIHGQHDGQQLLDERFHLEYLDRFGALAALRGEYEDAYAEVRRHRETLSSMRMDEAEKARRVDALTYQIAELDRAALREGEEEELSARRTLLRNAGKLTGLVETASQALSGDDEDPGAVGRLGDAARAIRQASRLSEEFAGLGGSLENLCSLAEDAAEQVRVFREGLEFSPHELDAIESRLDVLCRLKKKYGATVSDMLSYLEASRKELSRIESADETLAATEKRLAAALAEAKKRALCLSEARRDRAARLEESVARELSDLDMARVRFRAGFSGKDAPDGLDESGMDDVRFLLSANLGEEPKPLSKIASGGELARIMLALKNVMARSDDVGTLVFDEVDTGVSGRAAARVAEKLRQVARYRQVLCVTHLPQIAAAAATHFTVEKGERGGRTYTAVRPLSDAARIDEIARLLSGDRVTDAGRKNAAEMLRIARGVKES